MGEIELNFFGIIYRISDFKRAVLLSAIVGSWLVFFNQGSTIIFGQIGWLLYLRICLEYLTPFTVSSVTGILRNESDARRISRNVAEH